jgi:ubiquinone/menaquinone biosynthesis C-methylase UbiE
MVHTSDVDHHSHDRLIRWAWAYDLTIGLLGRRGSRLRAMFADELQLRPGDRVLDVGCGTGRLAMVFVDRVDPGGSVDGIDAAAEMIKRATARARKHGTPVTFQVALAQQLPFPDATFDAVACILALHHVADDDQLTAVREMYRVLKPGGRLLIAEFGKAPRFPHRGLRRLSRSIEGSMVDKALQLALASGFAGAARGDTTLSWLGKITAHKPPVP